LTFETELVVFTALHWMQGGLVPRKVSVSLSVCLSVCQTRGLWQNGRNICPDFVYKTKDGKKEWLLGVTLLPKSLGQPAPVGAKSPILIRYSLVAPQPLHLAKKFN